MDKHFASANNESDVSGGVGTGDATNSNPADTPPTVPTTKSKGFRAQRRKSAETDSHHDGPGSTSRSSSSGGWPLKKLN